MIVFKRLALFLTTIEGSKTKQRINSRRNYYIPMLPQDAGFS
jgi:hypothetical protein